MPREVPYCQATGVPIRRVVERRMCNENGQPSTLFSEGIVAVAIDSGQSTADDRTIVPGASTCFCR